MDSSLLLAIVAPGSVEARIGRLQESLFAQHGLASAAALPPLIPVAFPSGPRPAGLLDSLSHAATAPWQVRTTHLSWVEGWLFVGVSSDGMWSSIRAAVHRAAAVALEPLFPAAEGFFAGCGDATTEQRALITTPAPVVSFSSATIALVDIRSPRGRGDWWREVTWEFLETRPLRGRRKK